MAMELKQTQQLRAYLDAVIRKKLFIIMCLIIGVAIGLAVDVLTPKQYRATALLSYQKQKVNPSRMSPDQKERIKEMVSTISQIVLSRTSLEKIIRGQNLYREQRKRLPMEDVVEAMRKNIRIIPSKHGDTFQIIFEGDTPDKVAKTVNSLAAKFIEENLKYREERANETSNYAKSELQMAKVVLDKKEAAMRDYKLKHYNEMPSQQEINLTRLNSLQQQYQAKQDSIQDLERTRVMVQEQITERKNVLAAKRSVAAAEQSKDLANGAVDTQETDGQKIERLKEIYKNLLIKYTKKHPEVIRLRKIIEKLEQSEKKSGDGKGKSDSSSKKKIYRRTLDPVLSQLAIQMKKLEIDIDTLNKEKKQTKVLIAKYNKWVSDAPIREAEWASLTREYGELKKHYDYLVSRDLQAQSALHLEQNQQGSQFKIEDSGRVPVQPFKPDFYKIMGMAVMASLALGCGIALAGGFLDSSFRDVTDIETYLELPVVCSIPYISTEEEKKRAKIKGLLWLAVIVVSVCFLILVFFYFWKKGRIVL